MKKNTNPPANSPAGLLERAYRTPGSHPMYQEKADTDELALLAISDLRQRLNDQEAQVVFELRNSGTSWQRIADLTNMASRQAAQYRFARSGGLVDKLNEAIGKEVSE